MTTATYDAMGRPVSQTDANGNTTDIDYDALGRTVKETYPEIDSVRASKQVYYNDAANYITQTDENGWRQRTQYTPLGQVSRVYVGDGIAPRPDDVLLSSYEYDGLYRTTAEYTYDGEGDAPGNIRTTARYTYDRFDRVLTKTIDEAGYNETHDYNDYWPDPDEPGKVWARHQQTVTGDSTGAVPDLVSAGYVDQAGDTISEYLGHVRTAAYTYDKLGNTLSHTDALGHTVTNTYDYAGNNLTTERTVDGVVQTATTRYDQLGNKIAVTDYAGNTTTFSYDVAGRQLKQVSPFDDSRDATVKYYYDAVGNLTTQKTDRGDYWREAGYIYDARNRQTDVYQYLDNNKTQWNRSRYFYDAVGNKIEMRTGYTENNDDYAATRYAYDRFGNVTQVIDALEQVETNTYDKTGRLVYKVDRNGNRTDLEYDAMGHTIKESVTTTVGGKQLLSEREHTFAPSGTKLSDTGRETQDSTVLQELEISYRYDASGRIMEQSDPGNALKMYSYDLVGNRIRFRLFRNGQSADIDLWYTYDELNRLMSVRQGGQNGAVLAEYEYDANGNRTLQRYPQNNVETTYAYNKANLVTALTNKKGATVVSEFTYTYTVDGNQSSKTGPDGTTSYTYDRLGRLTQESVASWHTITYSYDAFSNRARMEVSGQDGNYVTTYTYDKNNRLLVETKTEDNRAEVFHYSYDANGNQTRRERQKAHARTQDVGHIGFVEVTVPAGKPVTLDSRHYNGFNQLVRVYRDGAVTSFTYRPDALRHSKQTYDGSKARRPKPTLHFWDGQNIVLEINSKEYVKAVYLRGITLIAQLVGESVMHYLHNAHGDVVQQVSSNGDAVPTYEYDAFGNQKEPNEEDPNPFRYCGEYFDKETEEIYLRNRYYDSRAGRFGQEDMARSGENWYGYCAGNPVVYSDPLGLETVWDPHTKEWVVYPNHSEPKPSSYVYYDTHDPNKTPHYVDPEEYIRFSKNVNQQLARIIEVQSGRPPVIDLTSEKNIFQQLYLQYYVHFSPMLSGVDAGMHEKMWAYDIDVWFPLPSMKQYYYIGVSYAPIAKATMMISATIADIQNQYSQTLIDPSVSPGPGWEWRGKGPPGSDQGAWYNPQTGESLHPDFYHASPIGPHWDYIPYRGATFKYRIYPDGTVEIVMI